MTQPAASSEVEALTARVAVLEQALWAVLVAVETGRARRGLYDVADEKGLLAWTAYARSLLPEVLLDPGDDRPWYDPETSA